MSFKDLFKKTVLDGFSTDITTARMAATLGIAALIGIFIYFVYKYKTKTSFYSKDFNMVLIGLPIITSAIVLAMQSNIVISLGMVGALSIVRFRNAIKNSMDLLYLFWSISIGIIVGGGLFELSCILSLILAIVLFLFDLLPNKNESLLLIINGNNMNVEDKIINVLKNYKTKYKMKSKAIHNGSIDLIYEFKSKKSTDVLKDISKIKNIENVSLIAHDGEERL